MSKVDALSSHLILQRIKDICRVTTAGVGIEEIKAFFVKIFLYFFGGVCKFKRSLYYLTPRVKLFLSLCCG